MRRAGIDIGGTFTDLVFWDDEAGQVEVHKLPSTPDDLAAAGLAGLTALLEQAGRSAGELDFLVHGTTVATNLLLEKNGAEVGMLTTRGFRDVLHIGRKNRPYNFSHAQVLPRQSQPLVRRRARLPVTERIGAPDGRVVTPLDEDEVRAAARQLREQGVAAVAICCLMAFLNPAHERRIREIVAEEHPDAYVSASHEVTPLYREYERFSTTALNAYVGPKTARYLDRFAGALAERGFAAGLNLMTSAGGIVPAADARERPVSLLLSGPVGALIAGIEVGRSTGHRNVITLDVGGTSADIGVAPDATLRMKHLLDTKVGDYDAMMPMVDIDTIGAGGGSIAVVDAGGMFRVGPESAGARPGPASYGHGGERPTVTDAMVALGWFRQTALAGSGLTIHPELAGQAIATHVAEPLGLSVLDAAAGIYRIATGNMVEAIRVNSVAKGYDPRDFALLAYGGAGAAFAAAAAAELAIPRVIVPPRPGVGAAAGLLATDTRFEHRATLWQPLGDPDLERLSTAYGELTETARRQLDDAGFNRDSQRLDYIAECRYEGQGYEIAVPVPAPPVDAAWVAAAAESFHAAHERAYTRRFDDKPVMIVNIGLAGVGAVPPLTMPAVRRGDATPPAGALLDTREVHFVDGHTASAAATAFYRRERLLAGNVVGGPAVVEQADTTTVLPPGSVAEVDGHGNLIVRFEETADAG